MGSNHNQPVDVDPHALQESRMLWKNFTKAATIGVVLNAAILLLMAFFLV